MKNKILGLPKAAVIVIGIVITALFLVLMNLVGGVVAHLTSITDSYTLQLIAEIGVAIYAIGMLFLMGYQQSLKKTGVGFLRGFYIGGFMVGYCVYVAVAQLFLQSVSGSDGVRSAGGIMIYILTMFLVGMNEEVIMRGIVLNLFADRFSNTRRGVLAAIILSSVIFGAAHIPNVLSGVPLSSALIQALQATLLGVLFAAIYLRSGNLWICIIIHALVDFAKGYGAKGLAYIAIHEDGSLKSSFSKFMTEDEMNALVEAMEGKPGDLLLFAADRNKIVWNVLGALRVELAGQMGLLDKNDYKFLWVTEFPQFEWSDEEERFVAMHHPFTMPMDEDLDKLETDPGSVRAKAYDIVLNGTEIGGGSVRIHQADVQSRMFKALGLTDEVANEKFGFLLDAFKYGVPPHAGLAYGLDRLVMLMAKRDSIRDVIAFPKVKDASCLLTNAPDVVDEKQLAELSINITETEQN